MIAGAGARSERGRVDSKFKEGGGEKTVGTAELLEPAGSPVFTGSAPVQPIFSRFLFWPFLRPNRTAKTTGSRFDRPVRSGSDNIGGDNSIEEINVVFFPVPSSSPPMASNSSHYIANPYEPSKPLACITLGNGSFPVSSMTITTTATPSVTSANPPTTTTVSLPVTTENPAYHTWRRQYRLIYGAISPLSQTKWPLWCLRQRPRMISGFSSKTPMQKHPAAISNSSRNQTADLLASLGFPVSVEDMTDHVLRGLDDGHRAIIDGVNVRDTPITFDDLLEKLLIQELSIGDAQRQPPAPLTALHAQARSNNNKPRPGQSSAPSNQSTSNRKPFLGRCQWCNIKGHVLSDCSLFKKHHPSVPPPPRHNDQAQAYTVSAGPSQTDFLVDIGATHHVTNDLANLALHHPYTGPDSLFMRNGSGLNISHSGTLLINDLSLSNALCVPSMKQQIIYVSKLTKQTNSAVIFLPNSFYVMNLQHAKQLIKAHVSMEFISGPHPHHLSTPFTRTPWHPGITSSDILHLPF
ncbi:hypothetical protein TSUD_101230 [Trifolium subterraneum]|uniref:Retrotransposon Copia-like N-terminal domain-containing protein n=1 Tax=Trifolium subterraneum TaxID=3900 RepID=A0A2Z6PDL7_TRISU|nr:hypothetical protein TSUD_101230 [Trifolium subterraneum]